MFVAGLSRFAAVAPIVVFASCSAMAEARSALRAGDLERARILLTEAADKGDPAAQRELGLIYLRGRGVARDPMQAFGYLARAAARGDGVAREEFAWGSLAGDFENASDFYPDPIDPGFALTWLRDSAVSGSGTGMYRLALVHLDGLVYPANEDAGIRWLRAAAMAGVLEAQTRLGHELVARPTVHDLGRAKDWLTRAARRGNADAQLLLARVCAGDFGGSADPGLAFKWFQEAASQGVRDAQYRLGVALRDGTGTSPSHADAMLWLREAAEGGLQEAKRALSQIYLASSETDSVTILHKGEVYEHSWAGYCDLQRAADCYLRAARDGSLEASFRLGRLYDLQFRAMDLDPVDSWRHAEHWLTRVGQTGHGGASLALGRRYLYGSVERGIEQNSALALEWLGRAAAFGNAEAQALLGWAYLTGHGIDTDASRAFGMLRRAAASGNSWAQCKLGELYERGCGVARDLGEARQWLTRAAEARVPEAAFRLGELYRRGLGVHPDMGAATAWYRFAAYYGHEEAERVLGGLARPCSRGSRR